MRLQRGSYLRNLLCMCGLMRNANQFNLCVTFFFPCTEFDDQIRPCCNMPSGSLYLELTNLIRDSGLELLLLFHVDQVTIGGCARALPRALLQILSARWLLYRGQHLVRAWDGS